MTHAPLKVETSFVANLCFHQMFEGMGLGGCILQVIWKHTYLLSFDTIHIYTSTNGIEIMV